MNKRGYAFAALLLTLCLLCGCSNVNLSSVTAFLTGEEQTEPEPQPVEETMDVESIFVKTRVDGKTYRPPRKCPGKAL